MMFFLKIRVQRYKEILKLVRILEICFKNNLMPDSGKMRIQACQMPMNWAFWAE